MADNLRRSRQTSIRSSGTHAPRLAAAEQNGIACAWLPPGDDADHRRDERAPHFMPPARSFRARYMACVEPLLVEMAAYLLILMMITYNLVIYIILRRGQTVI